MKLPGNQLRGSEIVTLRLVEVGKWGESGCARIKCLGELKVASEKLLQRGSFTERSGVGSRVLMGRAEGLSLNSGNSRILWDNHIVQLLGISGSESRHGIREVVGTGHDVLKLLIETASGLRLTKRHIRWSVVHAGLNKGVPGKLSLGGVVVDLEVLLITSGEGREGGLVTIRPILAVG